MSLHMDFECRFCVGFVAAVFAFEVVSSGMVFLVDDPLVFSGCLVVAIWTLDVLLMDVFVVNSNLCAAYKRIAIN